jgi:uncharacterized protein (DUF2141 family)
MTIKSVLRSVALCGAATLSLAPCADTLTVVIENVEASEGKIMLQVLSGAAEFEADELATVALMQSAQVGEFSFSTSNLPPGDYAVRIFHDRNGNGEMDSNFVGMPSEPWAFSNNATGNFGPPDWQAVQFSLQGSVTQRLRLNH